MGNKRKIFNSSVGAEAINCVSYFLYFFFFFCKSNYFQNGKFFYCSESNVTTCCFLNERCAEDYYYSVHSNMETKSEIFLRNTDSVLSHMESVLGYDSYHKIEGYNVSICANDCEEHAKSTFAKECTDTGGLYKCCIR